MSDANKAIVRRNFEEIWNKENLAVVDELHAPDYVGHIASGGGEIQGAAAFKQFVMLQRLAFPDATFMIEDQIAEGDKVATRWTARDTHKGTFRGIAPSGQAIQITGISIHRFVNGKIQESWDNWDALSMLRGMGQDVFETLSIRF